MTPVPFQDSDVRCQMSHIAQWHIRIHSWNYFNDLFPGVCVVTPSNRRFNVTVVSPAVEPGSPPQSSSPALPRARPNKLPFASIPEDHPLQLKDEDKRECRSRSDTPDPEWDFGDAGVSRTLRTEKIKLLLVQRIWWNYFQLGKICFREYFHVHTAHTTFKPIGTTGRG